jgi:glycosyltransferase involved in cell wall biosynthesis
VIIFYRNFMAAQECPPQCHIGLGVNALHTVRVLRRQGVDAKTYGVWTANHIRARLRQHSDTTHACIEAPWVPTHEMAALLQEFPCVHFIVRSHSNIGFLQVEAGAIRILRELLIMQEGVLNLSIAANSHRLKRFLEKTYAGACLYLPNLYNLERVERKKDVAHGHRVVRIASFGALRLLKNHTTAAAAALMVAKQRGCDLEFHISVNREEHGKGIQHALRAMFEGLCWARLVENPWADWASFRRLVGHMDLCMQLSHTETFNIVTADSAAEGVPCVVTPAIEWAPDYWKVETDAVEDAARVASHLLSSTDGAEDGCAALERFITDGTTRWLEYLDGQPSRPIPYP